MSFINSHKFDVMCLQEVSKDMLKKLEEIPQYSILSCVTDEIRVGEKSFLVIMGRCGFVKMKKFFGFKFTKEPINFWAKVVGWKEGIGCHCVDVAFVDTKNTYVSTPVRIFNIHLDHLISPNARIKLFRQVLKKISLKKTNILCGDLNIIDHWSYTIPYRLLLMMWDSIDVDERSLFQEYFDRHNIRNIFEGCETIKLWFDQPDHILVPQEVLIINKKVFNETHDSDHKPLVVEIDL